jgi:NitT/TauT family transport system substrate-binding protein
MQEVVINLLWFPQAQFAGYLMAEHMELGAKRGIRLRTTPLDFSLGPVRAVTSGAALFGVASPSHLLEARKPESFRLLLTIQQESPLIYPVRKDSGIRVLGDLAEKRVAVWPGKEDLEFRWMLYKAGVDPESVERVPMADTVAAFLAGEVASAQVTLYHELHVIEAKGLSRDRLHLFAASDHGAALIKDGLFTSRELAERQPELVQAVVDTVLEGWAHAFADPAKAVAACLKASPELSASEQQHQLAEIGALTFCHGTLTQGLGYPDGRHVERAVTALKDLGEMAADARTVDMIDDRFWRAAPAGYKVRS